LETDETFLVVRISTHNYERCSQNIETV